MVHYTCMGIVPVQYIAYDNCLQEILQPLHRHTVSFIVLTDSLALFKVPVYMEGLNLPWKYAGINHLV